MGHTIIDLNGHSHGVMGDPEEFTKQKERWEKRLNRTWEEFLQACQPSEVVKPDVKALFDTFNHRWQADCDTAERNGIPLGREALCLRYDAGEAERARRALYTGAITPEGLQLIGFRKWSDGTWRTHELTVEPIGPDWRINVTGDLCRDFNMRHIIRLMDAVDLKNLSPFNEEDYLRAVPAPSLWARFTNLFKRR